ncbi:MAG TPA: MBL fold metallo-hydrolase [Pyrinomonadaceae bacterium]|nr:MBL fold metallo-hydrolase [Pyrinomonadaceae bacterium]
MIFGDFKIEVIPDTEFRLDGGAMFGIVPRTLWERICPPDESNRIRMQTTCLFVEIASERVLIETGMGEKWTEKQAKIYGINRQKPFADSLIEKTGYKCEDITIVVNTHLHLDHAGGNTKPGENGKAVPAFPNARYFVSEAEYEHAENPTMRDRGSYIGDDWRPLLETGQLELKPENYEVVPGLTMQQLRGHNGSMQTMKITSGDEAFYSAADS